MQEHMIISRIAAVMRNPGLTASEQTHEARKIISEYESQTLFPLLEVDQFGVSAYDNMVAARG